MCITAPALVVGLDAHVALIELDGRRRRASTLVVPDVAVGDWVMVGAGTILRRLDAREGLELSRTINAAVAGELPATPAGGHR